VKRPAYELSFTAPADSDFIKIMDWSAHQFGAAAADRYEALIGQAVNDLREDPFRAGARHRPELPEDVYIYHLASCRERMTAADRVKAPRHFLLYRVASVRIEVLRILHDSRDLARHLPQNG
jgi:toxin ParE1/3/4